MKNGHNAKVSFAGVQFATAICVAIWLAGHTTRRAAAARLQGDLAKLEQARAMSKAAAHDRGTKAGEAAQV